MNILRDKTTSHIRARMGSQRNASQFSLKRKNYTFYVINSLLFYVL